MLFNLLGKCQNCGEPFKALIDDPSLIENCQKCEKQPFKTEVIKGIVYVVSNPNQTGVKVGFTEKTVEDRIKSLNSSGVAGKFEAIATFPSKNPKKDEKKCHLKMKAHKLDKEHFNLTPIDATLQCYRALNKREPIIRDDLLKKEFKLRLEAAKIDMQLKLSGRKGS